MMVVRGLFDSSRAESDVARLWDERSTIGELFWLSVSLKAF